MTVWVVRAGRYGQREDFALENGLALIGWDDLPDISKMDLAELKEEIDKMYSDRSSRTISIWAAQASKFIHNMQEGDLVILPLKGEPIVAIGELTGDYKFMPSNPSGAKHVRSVEWLETEIARTTFDDDILASLGSNLTVFQIRAEDAENRIKRMLDLEVKTGPQRATEDDESIAEAVNIEGQANDQIRKFMDRKFRSHNFANLIASLLEAKGYTVHASPPGPDGGVDIVAGCGSMGFDPPRMVVQVKSGGIMASLKMIRALNERIEEFGADFGLFVSWGGFERKVKRETSKRFFKVRLWDSEDVVSELKDNYEKLRDEDQAKLPLKQIWALVSDDIQFQSE